MAESLPVWFKCAQCGVQVRTEAARVDPDSRSYFCPKCGGRTDTRDVVLSSRVERRTFLAFAGGAIGTLLWGRRVFPMYPRTHTITLDDEMYLGRRLELRLPWNKMQAYVRELKEDAARTAFVRHPYPGGRTSRSPSCHVAKTLEELVGEGWKVHERELDVDPVEREIGRTALCQRRVSVPGEDDRFVAVPEKKRRLIFPVRAVECASDGRSEWVLKQRLQAGGMISGVWRQTT